MHPQVEAMELERETIPVRRDAMTRAQLVLLWMILALSCGAIVSAMRTTSTTFDEIVFMAGGARGFETGQFELAPDHPPLMQYVYGLPLILSDFTLPDESAVPESLRRNAGYRYSYAAAFFWGVGNDPERAAFLGRIPAAIMAGVLILATFFFTRRHWGVNTALLAAALVAFLPDVLAHGGIAYSDLPVTLAIFCAAWAIDEAVRSPAVTRGLLAGAVIGLALAVKISAAVLAPIAIALIGFELLARRRTGAVSGIAAAEWGRRTAAAVGIAAVAAYAVLVITYRGDILLEQFRYGLTYRYTHMTGGHGAAAFLLGQRSTTGWWYFFPVAFLFKTPAGLHVLLAIALGTLGLRLRSAPALILTSGLRLPAVGIAIFGIVLLTSSLNIGFRYALPLLPWICVLTAVGVAQAWKTARPLVRVVTAAAVFAAVAFPLSYYPFFISFISEYGPGRDRNHTVLVDSSLDWGQGLLALRDFMAERDIPIVHLSYFGSAWPAGYGIRYVSLPSFFALPPSGAQPQPEWVVISATNLQGLYLSTDPFARFRDIEPDAVLANTLFVYRISDGGASR